MADNIRFLDADDAVVVLRAIESGLGVQTEQSGNELGSQVDGHSATLGLTTDDAAIANVDATIAARLRGITTILGDVWDSGNHQLGVPLATIPTFARDSVAADDDPVFMIGIVRKDSPGSLVGADLDRTLPQATSDGAVRVSPSQIITQTPTRTDVASSSTAALFLAATLGRVGCTVSNDAPGTLYLLLGSVAQAGEVTSTNFTIALEGRAQSGVGGYYELPFGYVGQVRGIWASSPTPAGGARISEFA